MLVKSLISAASNHTRRPAFLLNALERYLFLGDCCRQLLKTPLELILVLFGREAPSHVEPLETTDRKRRLYSRHHHRNDHQFAAIGTR